MAKPEDTIMTLAQVNKEYASMSLTESHEALRALLARFFNGVCYCDHGLGNPMVRDHTPLCARVSEVVAGGEP